MLKLGTGLKGNANHFCDDSFYYFYNFLFFLQKLFIFIIFCFRLGNGLESTKRVKSVDKIRKRRTKNNTVNARINAALPFFFVKRDGNF